MGQYYPIHIDLTGKLAAIIGGGKIAERKVKGLLKTGAKILVVSPDITEGLISFVHNGQIDWRKGNFSPIDIEGAFLVIAATNNREVNSQVKNAAASNQLVNIADDAQQSNFIIPSVVHRGKLALSVSTSGASPILTKKIRQTLEQTFDKKYESYLNFLAESRSFILKEVKDEKKKSELLLAIVEDSRFFSIEDRENEFQILLKRIMSN